MAAWRHSAETGSALSVPASPRHAARLFAFRRRCGALFCAANLRVSSGADGAGPGNSGKICFHQRAACAGMAAGLPRYSSLFDHRLCTQNAKGSPGSSRPPGRALGVYGLFRIPLPQGAGRGEEAGGGLPPGLKIRGPSPSACALPGPLLQEDSQERRRDDEPDCHMRPSFALTAA